MTYGMSKEAAETFVASLAHRVGGAAGNGSERTVTAYRVEPYPGTRLFGVVERWTYNDRPDLGEFGGAFVRKR